MLQLLSKSLRQKVATITHFYSMLGLVAGKSCNLWVSCNFRVLQLVSYCLYMYFHSSEIRCLFLIKCSIETLKKWKKMSTNQFFPKSVEYKRQHTFIKSSWYYVVGIVKTCLLGIPSVNHDMGCIHKNVPTWTFSIPLKNLKVN